jgi:hypothetical protein
MADDMGLRANPSEAFSKLAGQLEEELSIPAGSLLLALTDQSDWAAVVKSHALLEGTMSFLLTAALSETKLGDTFARLPLNEDITGKLAFAKALGVLTSRERRAIKRLSELRNMLAHDPRHLGFSFPTFVAGLDRNQFTAFADALMFDLRAGDASERFKIELKASPRSIFNLTVIRLLGALIHKSTIARIASYCTRTERRSILEALGTDNYRVWVSDGTVHVGVEED